MSSRRDHLVSLERRIRRLAGRHNIDVLKPQKPDARVLVHGGYKLRDAATGTIIFGEKAYPFSASLEEVEEFLEQLGGKSED